MKRIFAFIIFVCIIVSAVPLAALANEEFVSLNEAVVILREAMVNREATVSLDFIYGKEPTNATFTELITLATEETGNSKEGDYLYWHLQSYGGTGDYSISGNNYYCEFTLNLAYYTSYSQEAQLEYAISDVISGFQFTESTDDITKIKTIYDFVCDSVTYDYDTLNDNSYKLKYTAYAALINGTAVCQGYANLMYRLLHEVGINNRIITGSSLGQNHAWNIIELNGVYYNADSTWDSSKSEYKYFLKCANHFNDHARNAQYTTNDFHSEYPMAEKCYTTEPEQSYCEKNGHDMGNWSETSKPSCTKEGEERRDCKNCDYFETRNTDTIPHTEGDWVTVTPAEVGKAGSEEKRCTKCKALLDKREIPALEPDDPTPEKSLGDVNGNGEIDKYDYILVKRVVLKTVSLDDGKLLLADVNKNGSVEKYDYILVKRHVLKTFVIVSD